MRYASVLVDDLRHIGRGLLRAPLFFLFIVLTFGVTIGANTAIFSVADTIFLKPLPVSNPQDLFFFSFPSGVPNPSVTPSSVVTFTHRTYEEFLIRNRVLSTLSAFGEPTRLAASYGSGQPGIAEGQFVSGSFFSVLGVNPLLGRFLSPDDESLAERHVVVGHRYWQERLGGNPAIVGSSLTVNRMPVTVIGVMPPGFLGVVPSTSLDLYFPLALMPSMTPARDLDSVRVRIVGRIDTGVSVDEATAQIQTAFHGILIDNLEGGDSAIAEQREQIEARRLLLLPAAKGMFRNRDPLYAPLMTMSFVVVLTLLIACVNVAIMMLGRSLQRRREFAVKLALGAPKATLARQILLQGTMLGVLGGLTGGLIAYWSLRVVAPLLKFGTNPINISVQLDLRIFAFITVLSILTGVVSSFALWVFTARTQISDELASGGTGVSRIGFTRHALLATQVFTSFVLLVVAGLFIRSLNEVAQVDPGIEAEGLLLASVDPTLVGYRETQVTGFYRDLYQRLSNLPGVQLASMAAASPMVPTRIITLISLPDSPDESARVDVNWVGPRYFEALGIPILEGRDIMVSDAGDSTGVAVINRRFAELFFPDQSPIGRQVNLNLVTRAGSTVTVVGVAENSKYSRITETLAPTIYAPALQDTALSFMTFVIRANVADPASLTPMLLQEVRNLDPNAPVFDVKTVTGQIAESLTQDRLIAALSGIFGMIGLFLTCLGIYGSQSYAVAAKRREVAIRIALGEVPQRVFRRVVGETLSVTMVGIALGLIAALAFSRLMSSLIYGVSPTDPMTIMGAVVIVLVVSFCSAYLPARRASRIPATTLLREP